MAGQDKPIILLIHGAWHIPLHYRYLIDGLRRSRYTVLAPSLVTTGYDDSIDGKTHLDATSQVREFILPYLDQGRKVVVVSHSYGGIVATQVSGGLTLEERAAQGLKGGIIGLVYIAALITPDTVRPPPGETYPFPPGWTDHNKRPMPADLARAILYEDAEPQRQDEALRLLVWQSEATCDLDGIYAASEVRAAKTYVVCKNDKIVKPENQYQRAKAAGATIVELECGHSPFLLEEETKVLIDVITKAAAT
ncbi:alpha/beta-hydrolase [Hypoxylon crocopeplum]|nr:alpha/beta-hydrolase [Hypoxylon crocopeplum]